MVFTTSGCRGGVSPPSAISRTCHPDRAQRRGISKISRNKRFFTFVQNDKYAIIQYKMLYRTHVKLLFIFFFCRSIMYFCCAKVPKRPAHGNSSQPLFWLSTPPLPQPVRHQFHRCCARLIAGGVVDLKIQESQATSFSQRGC